MRVFSKVIVNFVKSLFDNAGGINSKIIDKIFEPYFSTKKDKLQGAGLGLFIAKTSIEKNLKGKIDVKNIDMGVMFKLTIPKNL